MAAVAGAAAEMAQLEQNLDRAMGEVFGTMLGVSCARTESVARWRADDRRADWAGGRDERDAGAAERSKAGMRVSELMTGVGRRKWTRRCGTRWARWRTLVAGAWRATMRAGFEVFAVDATVVVGSRYELFSGGTIRVDRIYGVEGRFFR